MRPLDQKDNGKTADNKTDDQIDLRCFNSEPTDDPEHTLISPSVQCEPGIMALLKYWFKDCYDNHPYCRPPSPPFIPSRLLLIENEHSAKVLETKDCNAHYRYVALSHCWGDANRLKLQKSNMVDLLKHISITELPTTYREGISITLALGFSYIWIDSLCIIQDDEQDWAKEAAMMKDVFEHCSINLSATAAPDSSQSNFTHRDPTSIPLLEIDTLNQKWEGPGQSKHWLARSWIDLRREEISSSALHSRAWVFQEANLARRRIDLARSQMWWHCQQHWACETHPLGVWSVMGWEWFGVDDEEYYSMCDRRCHYNASLGTSMSSLSGPASSQTSQSDWSGFIYRYSNCEITKTKDRLIAFSGIAQRYAQDQGLNLNDYLAGIWRQDLPDNLLFKACHNKLSGIYRSDEYRAPSWSWISLEGPIHSPFFSSSEGISLPSLCRVITAKIIHQSECYKAGEVKGGVIHLRGRLTEVILGDQVPKWPDCHRYDGPGTKIICPSDFDEGQNNKYSVSYLEHPQGQLDQRKEGIVDGSVRKSISFETPNELAEHVRLFILPIAQRVIRKGYMQNFSLKFQCKCLILCQTLDDFLTRSDIYQRVGFHVFDDWYTAAGPERGIYII